MKRKSSAKKGTSSIKGLDGCYVQVRHTAIRLTLKDGDYQWGARDIHDSGLYNASQPDEFSCVVSFSSRLLKGFDRQCRFTRCGKTYTVKEMPNGEPTKFRRDDNKLFLTETRHDLGRKKSASDIATQESLWKEIRSSVAAVEFYLTGESIIRAATFPPSPSSKTPTTVRVSHLNSYGPVDSDVFVRLGDPKKPLGAQDFDTVSDWQKARLVEDLMESKDGEWRPRRKVDKHSAYWCGTYEAEFQFEKGYSQIEIKIVSRVKQVCSIVLSNWKVYVR